MAYQDFSNSQLAKVFETSELVSSGGFALSEAQQLRGVYLHIYRHGTRGGSERLRLKLYHDRGLTKLYATGSWAVLSTLSGFDAGGAWIGRVLFTFSDPHLAPSDIYYIAVESDSYTRVGSSFYLAALIDETLPHFRWEIISLRSRP